MNSLQVFMLLIALEAILLLEARFINDLKDEESFINKLSRTANGSKSKNQINSLKEIKRVKANKLKELPVPENAVVKRIFHEKETKNSKNVPITKTKNNVDDVSDDLNTKFETYDRSENENFTEDDDISLTSEVFQTEASTDEEFASMSDLEDTATKKQINNSRTPENNEINSLIRERARVNEVKFRPNTKNSILPTTESLPHKFKRRDAKRLKHTFHSKIIRRNKWQLMEDSLDSNLNPGLFPKKKSFDRYMRFFHSDNYRYPLAHHLFAGNNNYKNAIPINKNHKNAILRTKGYGLQTPNSLKLNKLKFEQQTPLISIEKRLPFTSYRNSVNENGPETSTLISSRLNEKRSKIRKHINRLYIVSPKETQQLRHSNPNISYPLNDSFIGDKKMKGFNVIKLTIFEIDSDARNYFNSSEKLRNADYEDVRDVKLEKKKGDRFKTDGLVIFLEVILSCSIILLSVHAIWLCILLITT